ncbi:MAG: galactokinase [Anaerolineae bacterium]|nr:galactokinase [Anaerolineae bacterium]
MDIRHRFAEVYHRPPDIVVWAPGRVNLIGEHTDYNQGYVFPAAIDRGVWLAASARPDHIVQVHAVNFDNETSFALDDLVHDDTHTWSNYLRGVAVALRQAGYTLRGMDAMLQGNLPIGANLSSSAAVEVATAYAFRTLGALDLPLARLPLLCQRAENEFVGVQSGIMDQFAVTLGRRDHALFLDCRSLDYRPVPIPPHLRIIVCDTRKERTLAGSAYNQRRRECEEGARWLGVASLRDVDVATLEADQAKLPEPIRSRVRHVVTENQRVLDMVAALEQGNLAAVRDLMAASHRSLRDDYQVSVRELDVMVEAAQRQPGCWGARMTGGGFGGATVNLVEADAVADFMAQVAADYQRATGIEPRLLATRAENGVRLIASEEAIP